METGTADRIAAVVAGLGALVCGGYFVWIGLGTDPGRRWLPFLLAALVAALFATMALRSWRRADRADRAEHGPDHDRDAGVDRADQDTGTDRVDLADRGAGPARGGTLSAEGRERATRILDALVTAGVLPGSVPDADVLAPALADHGEPVTSASVLDTLAELAPPGWDAHLAGHGTWSEQDSGVLAALVADLDRLAGPDHAVRVVELRVTDRPDGRGTDVRLVLDVAGLRVDAGHAGHPKGISTVPHVAVARALREAGGPRPAWVWSDQTVWIAVPRGTVPAELNDVLDQPAHELWEWVDEAGPVAAGEL